MMQSVKMMMFAAAATTGVTAKRIGEEEKPATLKTEGSGSAANVTTSFVQEETIAKSRAAGLRRGRSTSRDCDTIAASFVQKQAGARSRSTNANNRNPSRTSNSGFVQYEKEPKTKRSESQATKS